MGLYRTIPTDVEAVQFGGMKDAEPVLNDIGASLPSWLWKSITRGVVSFDTAGVKVNGAVLNAGDWIIYDGVFVSTMDDKKFSGTFTRARKPSSELVNAPKTLAEKRVIAKEADEQPQAAPQPLGVQSIEDVIPEQSAVVAPAAQASTPVGLGVQMEPVASDDVDAILNRMSA